MVRVGAAATALLAVVVKGAAVVVAAALILAMLPEREEGDPNSRPAAVAGRGPAVSAPGGDRTRVALLIAPGKPEITYVLVDPEGHELVLVRCALPGAVSVECRVERPILEGDRRGTYRACEVEARHGEHVYRLGLRADGSSDVSVSGRDDLKLGCLGVTATGQFVHDLPKAD